MSLLAILKNIFLGNNGDPYSQNMSRFINEIIDNDPIQAEYFFEYTDMPELREFFNKKYDSRTGDFLGYELEEKTASEYEKKKVELLEKASA